MPGNLRSYLAEFIGTFALVLACALASFAGPSPIDPALAYGATYAALAFTYGSVSGGHFNPALTIAQILNRRINANKGIFYIVSQLLGAALAGRLLLAALHDHPLMSSSPSLGGCALLGVGFKAATLLE